MKLINFFLFFIFISINFSFADINKEFENWKLNFKKIALENNISEKTFDRVMSDTKFLSDVIKYDRYQPEFYEDTKTYISKRTSSKKVSLGKKFYEKNSTLINNVENEFNIERELLLALMGIETNFGTYVGKMDILSSLATLSFDKRRSEFFTNELLILLRLIENEQIDYKTLYGSWAGAFGFFQFMPSTMKNYAIDHDGNGYIDLKNNNDAYASASNYLNQIGWKTNNPCFYRIDLSEDIPKKYLNISAKKLHDKKKEILGLDYLYFYDGINFKDGDPKPKGTPEHLITEAQKMYRELSEETGEFFDIMVNEELMDLVNREGKRPGGFCTSFPSYDRPYIFSNFNGTDHDITVLTHEAGHAFQCYSSKDQPLMGYIWPTMEAAEIHSMSMEFFTWPWMDRFFKEDTDKFKYKHISGSLSFLPYGACVDHFQHWVYENPNAAPRDRNQKWLEFESMYLPDRDYHDIEFPKSGGIWQGQLHVYQMPFYYIDYTLAQTCAFQFWMKSQTNNHKAWADYVRLCKAGGSLPFTDLVELAGLELPFNDGCLEKVIDYVSNWLDEVDPGAL